ncbi:DUF1566 domain-containing protein [Sulfuricurvum sp.]|uniref:Lcl C-terminal domain-containing protein n=1 Tax=Sulfuricurvum sp. TaxID=2025608 RepID=UPI00262F255D|nr:DUF1566 domain-containing protein [Sulfuricurvum sp.]MDD2267313.1 DUF1566 domain-containing protein [Sulfuricurvum sp.]MDD2783935.1 DUF1566 domain-containing protein [Sulfuricurvum sp.]
MSKIVFVLCFVFTIANTDQIRLDIKEVVLDTQRQLIWQDNSDCKKVKKTWKEAIEYCQNLDFFGYRDWRLPYIEELFYILDKTRIDVAINKSFQNVTSDDYWSSSDIYGGGIWMENEFCKWKR